MPRCLRLRPQINRLLWCIKDKEQEIDNLLRNVHGGASLTKQDKNAINQDLMELYRDGRGKLDDLLENFTKILSAVPLTVLLSGPVTVCSIHQTFTVYQDIQTSYKIS